MLYSKQWSYHNAQEQAKALCLLINKSKQSSAWRVRCDTWCESGRDFSLHTRAHVSYPVASPAVLGLEFGNGGASLAAGTRALWCWRTKDILQLLRQEMIQVRIKLLNTGEERETATLAGQSLHFWVYVKNVAKLLSARPTFVPSTLSLFLSSAQILAPDGFLRCTLSSPSCPQGSGYLCISYS